MHGVGGKPEMYLPRFWPAAPRQKTKIRES